MLQRVGGADGGETGEGRRMVVREDNTYSREGSFLTLMFRTGDNGSELRDMKTKSA